MAILIRINGIWERSNGTMIEINGTSGTYILRRKGVKRFLNKLTWLNIYYGDNNLWYCKVVRRDGRGRRTSRKDATLFLDGNILTLRYRDGKSISITHKRAYRKYEGNCVEPIEGIWESSVKKRYKIKGNTSIYILGNKKFINTISMRNIKYIANNMWVGEKSWRFTSSGKAASWHYTILELFKDSLYLTTPEKKWSGKYLRIR